MRIELEKRDMKILSAVEVWGVLGLGHVQGAFFSLEKMAWKRAELLFNQGVRQKGCAYRRLRKLELSGYLRLHRILGYPQVYGLTEKGHEALKARGLAKLPGYCKWVSAFTLNNRLVSASVGLLMKNIQGLPVVGERQIYQWQAGLKRARKWWGNYLIPDLMVTQRPYVPVEVELRQKSTERYHKLWYDYRSRFGYDVRVLYLAPSKERAAGLLRDAHAPGINHSHIFVLDIPTYQESVGAANFRNLYNKTFSIGEQPLAPAQQRVSAKPAVHEPSEAPVAVR